MFEILHLHFHYPPKIEPSLFYCQLLIVPVPNDSESVQFILAQCAGLVDDFIVIDEDGCTADPSNLLFSIIAHVLLLREAPGIPY